MPLKPLNWTPTPADIVTAKATIAWAFREMMNDVSPGLANIQTAQMRGEPYDDDEHAALLFAEGAFSAADTLGETMISKAWKRYQERTE